MGKSNSADRSAGKAAQAQAQFAQQLIAQTNPVRQGVINDATGYLTGNRDVTGLPEYAAAKASGEAQYGRARDAIIANTPAGGALTSALTNLEGQRAQGFANLAGSLSSNEIDRALQLATFGASAGTQGLSSAGAISAQRAQAEASQNAAKASGLGQAAGAAAGFKFGGPAGGAAGASAGGK